MNENRIRAELLKQVNPDSAIALEKVERYVTLTHTFYQLHKAVEEIGPVTVTKNGAQEFTKTNPAIDGMNKINNQLIALGRDLNIKTMPSPALEVDGREALVDDL